MSVRRRHGFTLIEITVAVLLLGVVVATVALSFARPLERLRSQDAAERVRWLDESARAQARRSGRQVEIVFDLSARTLLRRDSGGAVVYESALPGDCEIDRFRSAAEDHSSGEAVVACSAMGLTRSYAVHLIAPGRDEWLLFTGLSGQASVVNDEATLDSIFAPAPAQAPASARGGDDAR